MNGRRLAAACALVACTWVAACGDVVSQPIGGAPVTDGGTVDAPIHADAGNDATDAGSDSPGFCAGQGPIKLPGNMCLGDLANVFRFAACACDALDVSGQLWTDSFDSPAEGGVAGGDLASIAANGEVSTNSTTTIGGSVWSGGASNQTGQAVTLRGNKSTVVHDVQAAGPVEVGGQYVVEGDVWSNGNVTLDTGAQLTVYGTVHVPAGDSATGVQGTVVNGPVQVPPPCDCSSPIDVGTIVASFASDNDDSSVPISPGAPLPTDVTLSCGRYYVVAIAGTTVRLQVNGRVALFVAGDVNVTQSFTVRLAPSAELDLFVAGNFAVMGSLAVGDANAAARTRLYAGGPTFTLSANATPLAADVYAPNATVQLAADLEMWGALFAKSMQFSGAFTLHYDTSVLQVPGSAGCAPGGGACKTCSDCGGATPACKSGTCSPCMTNTDCCAPLVCRSDGQCVLQTQ